MVLCKKLFHLKSQKNDEIPNTSQMLGSAIVSRCIFIVSDTAYYCKVWQREVKIYNIPHKTKQGILCDCESVSK